MSKNNIDHLSLISHVSDKIDMSVTPPTLEGLTDEIKNREHADEGLQSQITAAALGLSTELKNRERMNTGLQSNLLHLIQMRQAKDAVLLARIVAHSVDIHEQVARVSRVDETMLTLAGELREHESSSEGVSSTTLADLAIELKNRESVDLGLQAQITASVMGLSEEFKNKEVADARLQAQITDEIKARESADENLESGLLAVIQARQATDAMLQARGMDIVGLWASVSIVDEKMLTLTDELRTHVSRSEGVISTTLEGLSVGSKTRETADAELQVQLTASMAGLSGEVKSRESADMALQTQITAEIKNKESTDAELQAQITTELKNRAAIDTEHQAQIAAGATALAIETKNRENADTGFQTQIATVATGLADEIKNQKSVDVGLQTQISAEIKNREHTDTELQAQITTSAAGVSVETKHRESADAVLQTEIQILTNMIRSLEAEMKQCVDMVRYDISTLTSTQSVHSTNIKTNSDRVTFYHPDTPPTKGT